MTDREQVQSADIAGALALGSTMMAISCSNARGRASRNNLARMYSDMFPRSWVHAAVFPTNASIQLSNDGLFLKPHYVQGSRLGFLIPPKALPR